MRTHEREQLTYGGLGRLPEKSESRLKLYGISESSWLKKEEKGTQRRKWQFCGGSSWFLRELWVVPCLGAQIPRQERKLKDQFSCHAKELELYLVGAEKSLKVLGKWMIWSGVYFSFFSLAAVWRLMDPGEEEEGIGKTKGLRGQNLISKSRTVVIAVVESR